jgi:hypothetical protein
MWITKTFKTKETMNKFVENNKHLIQWNEVFIDNGYAIEYRKLRIIDIQ